MFYVYLIKNERGKIYIGQTGDIERRLKRHNEYLTRSEALKREKHLKSHKGRDWLRNFLGC